jgi:hypothetical protein
MNKTLIKSLATLAASIAGISPASAEPATNQPAGAGQINSSGPQITFSTTNYNMGTVEVGEVVQFSYFFTNTGTSTLVVSNVTGTCGCTTAGDWTREAAPGQTGSIPIQVKTAGMAAAPTVKTVLVASNDKSRPSLALQITGTLVKALELTPAFAFLQCSPDYPDMTKTVLIVNKTDRPLVLSDPRSSHPALKAELQTTVPGKEFRLVLSTVPPLPRESVAPLVTVQTSFASTPSLTVPAFISIVPAISVIPPEISLPPAPLARTLTAQINFINNGPNALTLSNALVNTQEAKVSIQEIRPGKQYQATVAFPEGFAADPSQPLEFSVHSSDPRHPLLKVSVKQIERSPAAPARPAGRVDP